LVCKSKLEDYERMKNAIIDRLKHREDFVEMDLMAVERIARLHADWLWIEEMVSGSEEKLWRYSKLLNFFDTMLNRNMEGLGITPAKRGEILDKPKGEDLITTLVRKLRERPVRNEGSATSTSGTATSRNW
jgi:hypothetical protein